MVEEGLGDVQWHTLRISAFRLKYRVLERESTYECYRVREDEQEQAPDEPLDHEDAKILMAFQKAKEWA